MKEYYYGFDLSTTCCGYTILDENGDFVEVGYIKPRANCKTFFQKIIFFRLQADSLFQKYFPTKVFVESYFKRFNPERSTIDTILTLARFNGVVCYIILNKTGIEPILISVYDARKLVGFKKSSKGQDIKEAVLDFIQFEVDKKEFTNKNLIFEKTRTDRPKPYSYDISDSVIIAKAGYKQYAR